MAVKHGATKVRILFLVVACALLAVGFVYRATRAREVEPMQSTQFVMDTVVKQRIWGPNAVEAVRRAEELLQDLDGKLSLFREDSEVSAINASAGIAPVAVSKETFEVIRLSVEFAEASGGNFDITIAPLKTLWDITGEHPRRPEQSEIETILPLVDYRDLVLDEENSTVFLPHVGQSIDLGGVAKGYAAQKCIGIYHRYGVSGYIDIGRNVYNVDGGMLLGIRAPRGDAALFGTVDIGDEVIATSGDYERYFEQDGVRYHHILDPATGWPAQSGLVSVSVIGRDGAQADFLSTTLFLRGKEGLDSLRNVYDYEYIAVDKDLNVTVSPGLRDKFELNSEAEGYHLIS